MGKYTKKETDFWGNEKEVHYEDGKKVGETKHRDTFWGGHVQDHFDKSGNKVGETRRQEGLFGDKAVHYNSSGNKTGYTKNDETFFGDSIQRHYDDHDNQVGKSHYEEGLFGGRRKVHNGEYFKDGRSGNKSSSWNGNEKSWSSGGSSTYGGRSGASKSSGTFGKILLIFISIIILIWILRSLSVNTDPPNYNQTQKYTLSPNLYSSSTGDQRFKSLLNEDTLAGKAKTWRQTKFYPNIITMDTSIGNTYYPAGSPIGKESYLVEGEHVEIYNIFPNDSESKYTLKIKTNKGIVGYVRAYVDLINTYGEKGDLLSIYLSLPYEYEGNMERVKGDISKFKAFIDKYPNSSFIPEILHEIQWRQKYLGR